jgi:N-acyl-D-aspartate/D-glutamate deacylase
MHKDNHMYDIIVKNALVIDGAASAPVAADVAITGRNIAEVGRIDDSRAPIVIDAGGCAAAGNPLAPAPPAVLV